MRREIISGDQVHLPQAIPDLPRGWEGAFVFDPNSEQIPSGHPSQDLIAWLISNQWALLMVLDGASKGKPGSPSANYDSGPVTIRFAEEAMRFAGPLIEAGTPFKLSEMHYHAGRAIKQARDNEDTMPEGGLVGVSSLLLPDGWSQTHHFGDPHNAESTNTNNPDYLAVPEALWPENVARDLYLAHRERVRASTAEWPLFDPENKWLERMLIPSRNDRQSGNVTHHASTVHGLHRSYEDHRTQLPSKGSLVRATDGLGLYPNLEAFQRGSARTIQALLEQIYMFGKTGSEDNIAGVAARWNPENV